MTKIKIMEQTQEALIKQLIDNLDEKSAYIVHKIVELEHKITTSKYGQAN